MVNRATLAIDIGTSSVKIAVISDSGDMLSYSRVTLDSFYGETDPALSWEIALKEGLSLLDYVQDISAVCVAGNGPTLVPLGVAKRPIGPTISWIDRKAKPLGDCSSLYLPRLMQAIEDDPSLYDKSTLFIGCPEYMTMLLTDEAVTFLPSEQFRPFIWDDRQLSICGISSERLPPMVNIGDRVGYVSARAAEDFGLPSHIPVFAGLIDFHAALLGCGVVRPGMTLDRAGTSEGINYIAETPLSLTQIRTLPSLIADTWTVAGLLPATGEVFEWFKKSSGLTARSYHDVTRLITKSIPQQDYVFYPVRDTSRTLGDQFFGGRFSDGGSITDDLGQRGRAVIEGIGFSVRKTLELLQDQGCKINSLRHCGGQARSFHWNYIKSQILRIPVEVPKIIDAELLGCAITCFTGMGDYAHMIEAADDLVEIEHVYSPIQRTSLHYESHYQQWLESYDSGSQLSR